MGDDVTYKDALIGEMLKLAEDKRVKFIGYNVAYGPQFNGTLTLCPRHCLIETPCAENLMMGIGMGMALEGFIPIVCFERMDFIFNGMDAIVNHLCKLPYLSGDQFDFPLVIRACVGHNKPLDPGPQHVMDYSRIVPQMCHIDIRRLLSIEDIQKNYSEIPYITKPIMLVEYRSLYEMESTDVKGIDLQSRTEEENRSS